MYAPGWPRAQSAVSIRCQPSSLEIIYSARTRTSIGSVSDHRRAVSLVKLHATFPSAGALPAAGHPSSVAVDQPRSVFGQRSRRLLRGPARSASVMPVICTVTRSELPIVIGSGVMDATVRRAAAVGNARSKSAAPIRD